MTMEDKRTAVSLWVTLSSQVMGATLALIAVEGAFTTFVLDKRLPPFWFYLIVTLTLLLFIVSILNGGAGISRMTREGEAGRWGLDVGAPYFKRQTLLCLLGVLLFFASLFFSGPTKEESQAAEIKTLQDKTQKQELQLNGALSELQMLRTDLNSSKEDVNGLRQKVEQLRQQCKKPLRAHIQSCCRCCDFPRKNSDTTLSVTNWISRSVQRSNSFR
jgi:hypothetical protein